MSAQKILHQIFGYNEFRGHQAAIIEHLGLTHAQQFISSFDRPNIRYRIVQKNNHANSYNFF